VAAVVVVVVVVWAAAPHPVEQIHFSDLLSFSLPPPTSASSRVPNRLRGEQCGVRPSIGNSPVFPNAGP
jgi:hypothetical protein